MPLCAMPLARKVWPFMMRHEEMAPSLQARFATASRPAEAFWDLWGSIPMGREQCLVAQRAEAGAAEEEHRARERESGRQTRAMQQASERRGESERALARREKARRKREGLEEATPDSEWESRVGEVLRKLGPKRIRKAFDAYDADGGGKLDSDEFVLAMRMLGLAVSEMWGAIGLPSDDTSLPLLPASAPASAPCLCSLPLLPASAPCFRCLPSTYCPPLLQITHLKPTPRYLCWLTIPCQTPRLSHVCQGLPNDVGFRIFSKHDKEGEGELPRDVLIASCQEAYEEKPKLNSIQ